MGELSVSLIEEGVLGQASEDAFRCMYEGGEGEENENWVWTYEEINNSTSNRTLITINDSNSKFIGIFIRFPYYTSAFFLAADQD